MQGDKSIILLLNQALTWELTSINQYFLHARIFNNWGLQQLNRAEYKKSILDMKQADRLIERILFLEGLPNLQHLEKLRIGEQPAEMLQCDLSLETVQITQLKEAIQACEKAQDYVSRQLLEELLHEEEEQVDWLETQQQLIEQLGLENYLQAQAGGE